MARASSRSRGRSASSGSPSGRSRGPRSRCPTRCSPTEIEKTLRKLGDDGDKVRGAIERDFASYVGKKTKERRDARNLFLIGIARPFLLRGVKAGVDWLTGTDEASVSERIALVRARAERQIDEIQRERRTTADGTEEPPTGV